MDDSSEQAASGAVAAELAGLHQLVAELRLAVRARDDFITIAAHELRNPMTPLVGLADLALAAARRAGDGFPPRITALLERMQLQLANYVRQATRLLDVSRIQAGNLRLEPFSTDLSTLVLAIAERYEIVAAHAGSPLLLEIADGITGVCDGLAVEQIVENLLSNAIKFGLGKPVAVRLRLESGSAWLEVQDQGVGMPPGQQARMFERFEQVVAQHRGGGFGVGLWVASRLVEAMRGRIAVASRMGEGSIFTVTLPMTPS